MEERERLRLTAFREVAREVRESSIVATGLTIKQYLRLPTGDAPVCIETELLPSENLRSLCVSVRNVYMEEGPAHFYAILKIAGRYGAQSHRERIDAVRAAYERVLRGNDVELRVGHRRIEHESLFKDWLNKSSFHKDTFKDGDEGLYRPLRQLLGEPVDAIVQKVVLQIAGCVLDLDDVIADLLGEALLPRIAPPEALPA